MLQMAVFAFVGSTGLEPQVGPVWLCLFAVTPEVTHSHPFQGWTLAHSRELGGLGNCGELG